MENFQISLKYCNNIYVLCKKMQILTHNLRGSAKKSCYLRKRVVGEENAFHSIQGRAFNPF